MIDNYTVLVANSSLKYCVRKQIYNLKLLTGNTK